jgi:SAM-dependent methyltransferase
MLMNQLNFAFQKQYWEKEKKRRDPQHPVIKAFVQPKIAFIQKQILNDQPDKHLSLLDIGCGNGFFTYYLERSFRVVALDFSILMLKKNPLKNKICGSAVELPFQDKSFDVLFCSNLLHHIDDPDTVVSEMKRVSRKYIVLSEPNRNNPLMFFFGLLRKAERGTLKYSMSYMKQLTEKSGLKLIGFSQAGVILPNMTPLWLLPILKKFDGKFRLGFYNIVISERK